MTPRIQILDEKKLVGERLTMNFADYKIGELLRTFSPRRKEIANNLTNDLFSLVVYKPNHFADFKLTNEFERWATIKVISFDNVPTEMETFILQGGLYAVFDHKGLSTSHSIFRHILA